MDQLTPTDATHIFAEQHGSHVSRVVDGYIFTHPDAFGGPIDLDRVLTWLRPRIDRSPVFRSRLRRYPGGLGYPYWEPASEFDLAEHVTVEASPGVGWEPVRDRVAAVSSTRLASTRPPWELLVITGLTGIDGVPDGSCLVVLKVHHAVGDGMETVELARGLFAAEPLPAASPTAPVPRSAAVVRAILCLPNDVIRFVRGAVRAQALTRAAAAAVTRGDIERPRFRWPSTRFNRHPGPGFTFGAVTFDLAEIAAVRSAHPGVTVTDVAVSVIAGAMSSYLRECGEEPAESLGGKVSFSMRPILDSRSKNNFVVLSVDLHTDLADPVVRLRAIHESMAAEKVRFRDPAVAELSGVLDVAPAPYVNWLSRRRSRLPIGEGETVALGNTMISNVPRDAGDMRFLGGRVIEGFGVLGVGDGSCLNHYIVTVGSRLTVTFGVDPERMPDTERYATLLRESLRELVGVPADSADAAGGVSGASL